MKERDGHDMSKVTVVIPNYNGSRFLRDCMDALKEQSFKDFDVVIVDNGSKDNGTDIVRECCPEAKIIQLDKNYGFSKAVNEGIKAAKSEYVILLNNDTKADKDFVKEMLAAIESDEKIFSVSARMLRMDAPDLIDSAGDLYCCLGWAFARGKDKSKDAYDRRCDVFSACAGAAIYRKSLLNVVGCFDEKHFAYLEDVDIGYRARINGYRNVYEPSAVVYHVGSGMSGSRYNAFKIGLSSRNSVYVPYKNMPLLQLLINLPFLLAGYAVKTLFFIRKGEGAAYLRGLGRGVLMCVNGKKYPFKAANIKNYCRIQFELWINTIKRFGA